MSGSTFSCRSVCRQAFKVVQETGTVCNSGLAILLSCIDFERTDLVGDPVITLKDWEPSWLSNGTVSWSKCCMIRRATGRLCRGGDPKSPDNTKPQSWTFAFQTVGSVSGKCEKQ